MTIKNKIFFLFFMFALLFISCEDKLDADKDFGSIKVNFMFENQVYNSSLNDPGSGLKIIESEIIAEPPMQYLKKETENTGSGESVRNENDNRYNIIPLKRENTKISSIIKYVIITIEEITPVEINVSGSTVSTTINDIPLGPQIVLVELLNQNKIILYQQTREVTIVSGETATPLFNKFKVINEFIEVNRPTEGEFFEPGENMLIQWTGSHENIPVDIDLYNNNQKLQTIKSNASNSGLYTWLIPSNLTSGIAYRIKIISTNNPNVSDLSGYFLMELNKYK